MYKGPWGTFVHIPKCAGISVRNYLMDRYNIAPKVIGKLHDRAINTEDAWTVIRHPVSWIRSFYAYMWINHWTWGDLPDFIHNIFKPYYGMFFPQFVNAVATEQPNAVMKIYDYYIQPGVQWYRIEEVNDIFRHFGFRGSVPAIHKTEEKPLMTEEMRNTLRWSENLTIKKYGYEYYG